MPSGQVCILQIQLGGAHHHTANGGYAFLHMAPRRLRRFDVGVQRPMLALLVEVLHQGQQARRLARLPWRMEDEVAMVFNQVFDPLHVDALQGINHEVTLEHAGASGIELFHAGIIPDV
jgi:hypothetical protein